MHNCASCSPECGAEMKRRGAAGRPQGPMPYFLSPKTRRAGGGEEPGKSRRFRASGLDKGLLGDEATRGAVNILVVCQT